MRFEALRSASLLVLILAGSVGAGAEQPRGVVNGITLTPKAARTGTPISANVTGVNPCGAVFIDWGDGTAITHPIVDLPFTHTHAYSSGGDYTVRARGMGNCDGDVTASVRIEGPAPAPTQPRLTGLSVASPGGRGEPVNMRMEGQGACSVSVAFGDGNTQELSVQLPHTFTHVYSVARGYNVTAAARPPCEGGRHTARLEIEGGPSTAARISGIAIRTNPVTPATATIQVAGNGTCSYILDYGDGNNERRNSMLPERVNHVYPSGGTYVVTATAEPPCEGRVQDTLTTVARQRGAVDRMVITPGRARIRTRVNVTIEGRGSCKVFVDFADGNEQTIEGQLPLRLSHSYARPGRYEVFAWTEAPCNGDAGGVVQVDR